MRPSDLVRDAVRGVRLHRVRSRLTAAGFAAGTAGALALFAITGGARAEILHRLANLGIDLVSVRPVGRLLPGSPPPLTYGDAQALRETFGFVRSVAPVRMVEANVLLPSERVTVRVVGTTDDYFSLRRFGFERGRAFSAAEVARGEFVCVLGAEAARRLVASREAYGSLVKVGGNWYRVIGVLARAAVAAGDTGGEDPNAGREVYVPITNTFRTGAFQRQSLQEAWLSIDESVDPEIAAPVVESALERRHEGKQHFEVATAARLLSGHHAARGLLNQLLAFVVVAAFALGGVGMMSVCWQNVRERTREIAVRRAVGARQSEVLAQFVLEGLVLAAAGAVGGTVVGLAGSAAASWIGGWPWTLSLVEVLSAVSVALIVGLVSALYPASYAAALDPVTALRFER